MQQRATHGSNARARPTNAPRTTHPFVLCVTTNAEQRDASCLALILESIPFSLPPPRASTVWIPICCRRCHPSLFPSSFYHHSWFRFIVGFHLGPRLNIDNGFSPLFPLGRRFVSSGFLSLIPPQTNKLASRDLLFLLDSNLSLKSVDCHPHHVGRIAGS